LQQQLYLIEELGTASTPVTWKINCDLSVRRDSKAKREKEETKKPLTSVAAIDLRTSSFKTKWTCKNEDIINHM
jgi:hypothetical protein